MAGGAPGWSTGTGAMVREPPVEVKGLLSYVKGYGEQSYLLGKQPREESGTTVFSQALPLMISSLNKTLR